VKSDSGVTTLLPFILPLVSKISFVIVVVVSDIGCSVVSSTK
jgi:hypothetical protein